MFYHAADVPRDIASQLWSAVISPRPVFLVASKSEDLQSNIAAFSSIGLISIYPPIISISFGKRRSGPKFTLQNILATRHFSLNGVPRELAETANKSAEGLERADDFRRLGLTAGSFDRSPASAIIEAPLSIACELLQTVEIMDSPCTLILARCRELIVCDRYVQHGLFDPIAANLVGSTGLEDFITVRGESFALPRTWE